MYCDELLPTYDVSGAVGVVVDAEPGAHILVNRVLQQARTTAEQAARVVRQRYDWETSAPTSGARRGARFSGWDELGEESILTVRSGLDARLLVDQVADWLDARAPALQHSAGSMRSG